MCLSVHQLCYVHADKEPLFQNINLIVNTGQRLALVGNNGTGKSTLLRIIEGNLKPSSGEVVCSSRPYYIPQHFGQFDNLTVAEALRVDDRIKALHAILEGDASAENFTCLNDDWNVEERCLSALASWNLEHLQLSQPMCSLSGGEKTKVFLSGILVHAPEIILMDEPTSALDPISTSKIEDLVMDIKKDYTIIMVTHNMQQAARVSDKTVFFLLGEIIESGETEQMFSMPKDKRTEDYITGRFG